MLLRGALASIDSAGAGLTFSALRNLFFFALNPIPLNVPGVRDQ